MKHTHTHTRTRAVKTTFFVRSERNKFTKVICSLAASIFFSVFFFRCLLALSPILPVRVCSGFYVCSLPELIYVCTILYWFIRCTLCNEMYLIGFVWRKCSFSVDFYLLYFRVFSRYFLLGRMQRSAQKNENQTTIVCVCKDFRWCECLKAVVRFGQSERQRKCWLLKNCNVQVFKAALSMKPLEWKMVARANELQWKGEREKERATGR